MSTADVEHSAVMSNTGESLNTDLLQQLNAMQGPEHIGSECWGSASSLVREATLWILLAAVLWIGTLWVTGASA
jgi:hypothetical protein